MLLDLMDTTGSARHQRRTASRDTLQTLWVHFVLSWHEFILKARNGVRVAITHRQQFCPEGYQHQINKFWVRCEGAWSLLWTLMICIIRTCSYEGTRLRRGPPYLHTVHESSRPPRWTVQGCSSWSHCRRTWTAAPEQYAMYVMWPSNKYMNLYRWRATL